MSGMWMCDVPAGGTHRDVSWCTHQLTLPCQMSSPCCQRPHNATQPADALDAPDTCPTRCSGLSIATLSQFSTQPSPLHTSAAPINSP